MVSEHKFIEKITRRLSSLISGDLVFRPKSLRKEEEQELESRLSCLVEGESQSCLVCIKAKEFLEV